MTPARFNSWLRQRGHEIALAAHTRIVNGLSATSNLLFPPVCTFCGNDMPSRDVSGLMLCTQCVQHLVVSGDDRCSRCASPLPRFWRRAEYCPRCLGRRYYFDRAVSLGDYRADMQQAVLWMKRPAFEPLSRSMGRLLADRIARHWGDRTPELVVSVPMHWRRRLARGTNTSGILATTVSRELSLPLAKRLLKCRRKTNKQGMLRPRERVRNVRDAFCISSGYDITDKHVVLVDDILTTGATASEAARVLRKAGAGPIYVAVVARGIGET